jgi:hypothetical protein
MFAMAVSLVSLPTAYAWDDATAAAVAAGMRWDFPGAFLPVNFKQKWIITLISASLGLNLLSYASSQPENVKVLGYSWHIDSLGFLAHAISSTAWG